MVELICAVVPHVYIEQCINMLNTFKVNYKDNGAIYFEVTLVFLLNLKVFVRWNWLRVTRHSHH